MTKCTVVIFTVAVLLTGSFAHAAVISPNLPVGSQYQLVFVTDTRTNAFSTDIGYYNTFVANEAATSPDLPSTTWKAVASTSAVDANINAPSGGLPVYNTAGILAATAATGLYTLDLLSPIQFNQFGNPRSEQVWTGSTYDGFAETFQLPLQLGPLGSSVPATGMSHWSLGGGWMNFGGNVSQSSFLLYALSSPITVVPEPSSVMLAAFCIVSLILWRRIRRA